MTIKSALYSFIAVLVLIGCSKHEKSSEGKEDTLVDEGGTDLIVRSQAQFSISVDRSRGVTSLRASGTQPVTVTNAEDVSMSLDNSKFKIPTISNDILDFGNLSVSALRDNNLSICGANGKTKCTKAIIRVYTTGVAGAGIYNTAEGYGSPITASLTSAIGVGLNVAGAAVMQTFTIPASKRVVKLSDFTPTPNYNIKSDFTEAGAGSFSTTIVVEYALGS